MPFDPPFAEAKGGNNERNFSAGWRKMSKKSVISSSRATHGRSSSDLFYILLLFAEAKSDLNATTVILTVICTDHDLTADRQLTSLSSPVAPSDEETGRGDIGDARLPEEKRR